MGLDFDYIEGQTPIDEDEKDGLLIPTIATRGELDEFEQLNIEEAVEWILIRSFKTESIFTDKFIRNLHIRMFGNVWNWAGTYRKTNKNLGVDKWEIQVALKCLCDDAIFWIENDTFPPDEIALRFKHRIVSIHCFPNGNGRHSRLMADIIIKNVFKKTLFSWGTDNLTQSSKAREIYINAVRSADRGDYNPLMDFARS